MAVPKEGKVVLGLVLLLVVNMVWVLSAEVTKYLFVDLNFKRPFFATYVKSCLFSIFLIRYLICGPHQVATDGEMDEKDYSLLDSAVSDDDAFENESLTLAEFEPLPFPSDYESEDQYISSTRTQLVDINEKHYSMKRNRKVRFSLMREVRRLPEKIAYEAKLARLPYRPPPLDCRCDRSPAVKYILYFAPLWFLSSVTYQAALVFSSVSTVNMISASSSLFVLLLGAFCSPYSNDRFSFLKFGLVILNLGGVAIVSQFSSIWIGTALATVSALVYAIYLVLFSVVSRRNGYVDMNLLFGVIGIFSLVVCTPLMFVVHFSGLEPQLPLPSTREMLVVLLNGFVGSVLTDYLWLYATLMTNSLISSISLTMTIPLSMVADAIFRLQYPDTAQLLASIPIMVSFMGASLMSHVSEDVPESRSSTKFPAPKRGGDVRFRSAQSDENERLMDEEENLDL